MKKIHLLDAGCACVLTLTTITTQATLIGVLPATPGDTDWQAYYDDQLDITWAANANVNSDIKWDAAVAWAANLTIGGVGGWRLPSVDVNNDGTVVDCTGGGVTGCFDNEYGYLYWEENVTGGNPTPFDNLGNHDWWSGTE